MTNNSNIELRLLKLEEAMLKIVEAMEKVHQNQREHYLQHFFYTKWDAVK